MASVRESNRRHANAARFIGSQSWKPGSEPAELVLLCWTGDESPQIVCRWPWEAVTEELGFKVSELVDDYADGAQQHGKAELQFRAASGEVLTQLRMRALYSGANSIGMGAVAYDGTMGAQLQQNQKHLEAVMGKLVGFVDIVEQRQLQHIEVLDRIVARIETTSEREAARERERAEALRAELDRAEELLHQAVQTAEESAKAADDAQENDRVGQVIELVTKSLQAPKA